MYSRRQEESTGIIDNGKIIYDWYSYLEYKREQFDMNFARAGTTTTHIYSLHDFKLIKTIGVGAFGRVMLIKGRDDETSYAAKIFKKSFLIQNKLVNSTKNEKNILLALRFPFAVRMEFFFIDNSYIYFVMPLIDGGELFVHLRNMGRFTEKISRFFAAQVLLALEYLHYLDLIYRDLKPENILLDKDGYLKVTDFGFCKRISNRTYTFCGTPEYIAPEILLYKGYGKSVDFWAFGVLLYELNSGVTPFYAKEQSFIYDKIVSGNYKNKPFFSDELRDIIRHLLQRDLSRRYGNLSSGVEDIKEHGWFRNVLWRALLNKQIQSPYFHKMNFTDLKYFDKFKEVPMEFSSTDEYTKEFRHF